MMRNFCQWGHPITLYNAEVCHTVVVADGEVRPEGSPSADLRPVLTGEQGMATFRYGGVTPLDEPQMTPIYSFYLLTRVLGLQARRKQSLREMAVTISKSTEVPLTLLSNLAAATMASP
jgi:hypothetical protein